MTLDFLALDHDIEIIEPAPAVLNRIDLNGVDRNGMTPLLSAVEAGAAANLEMLMSVEGVDVNAKDGYGRSALHLATIQGRADLVTPLLSAGMIDLGARDRGGVLFLSI
jgi:ankyrin repeat protein